MKPKILFTSVCKPFANFLGQFSSMDQMAFRLTRGQEPFVFYEHTHFYPLHLIAQNLTIGSVVLEYPTLSQLNRELENNYDYVAISFKTCDAERLLEMCDLVRKKSPNSIIIVGGYGAICASEMLKDNVWDGKLDKVCKGDGISYMRNLFNEPLDKGIRCNIPKGGSTLPWLNPQSVGSIGIILSGIGCTKRCYFCATSAFTNGKYVEIMNAEEIYQSMRSYWDRPFTNTVTIHDENFLDHRDKVNILSSLLQKDRNYGLVRYNYTTFSSLSAIAKYEPEELLLSGIDTVWIGVESKFTSLSKRKGMSPEEGFEMLHSIGIKTIGSWIIGDNFQNHENIKEDMDFFISLDPTFQQLAILIVGFSTPLWEEYKRTDQIPPNVHWRDYHLYGKTFDHKHFSHKEMLCFLEQMYRRIFVEKGPAVMKLLEVNLNGYEWCMRSNNTILRQQKSEFFRTRCQNYFPLIKTALAFAPSVTVRTRLENLNKRYQDIFGKKFELDEKLSDIILRIAEKEMERCRNTPIVPRKEEPCRRYTYPEISKRRSDRPYEVEYLSE